ncbi:Transposon Tf2-9 polyprotein [Labeo rohita]|uniref:Transposon Tf2-9 polyprotein n=1 Tax=Labeo rohita TaxID=84645 RepID=A0ABQ8M3U5_LABRO|nr:Transposon Tf2-9 polyprotein [Labeo rohita]
MESQEEQMMATGRAVQALVAQVSELTTQLQQLKVETASTQQPLTSDPPATVDQTVRSTEPRLPPPAFYSALVNDVLRDMEDQFIYVYLDDILILSHSLQEHVQHSVPFLGYIVSAEGVRMDSDKVQVVVNWPTSDSRKALQRFLGFASYYRQLATPLTALTSTKTPFRWSSAADAAFAKLKSCFVSAPILVAPDPSRQFVVEVDASEVGVGMVLSQRSSADGKMHPCAYFSHRLSPAKRNYDIGNRELLAVKLALEEWRHCSHHLGSKNIKPDALSRIFDHSKHPSFPESIVPQKVFISAVTWEIKVCTASQGVTPSPGCPPGKHSGFDRGGPVLEGNPFHPSAQITICQRDSGCCHVFRIHGLPMDVVSDRGPQFVSKFWREFCHLLGATNPSSWSQQFSWVEYAHNLLPVSATGLSPFECSLGYQPPVFSSMESEVTLSSAHTFVQRCQRT